MKTKDRLAAMLRENGLHGLADRARAGAYDDYESDSATPLTDLVASLRLCSREDLAQRVVAGDFDGTREEADAWMQREGRYLFDGRRIDR